MKSVKVIVALFIFSAIMTSCATTQPGGYEDRNTRRIGNRVYVDDPYYGNVVLERDPVTGRYYDVTNGYRTYARPYYNYDSYRSYRSYDRRRSYPNISNSNGTQTRQFEQGRNEARKKVLCN